MSWEGFKNILLVSLILISGLLTWSYWFYQPTYNETENTNYVQEKIFSNLEPDEVVKPTKMIYHKGNLSYGTYSEEMITQAINSIKKWNMFNFQDQSSKYKNTAAINKFSEKDGFIELIFNDIVPLSFYKNYLKIEDNELPNVKFDRVIIHTDNDSIYFVSSEKKTVIEASVDKSLIEDFTKEYARVENLKPYTKLKLSETNSILVPSGEIKVSKYDFLTKATDVKSFKEALFIRPSTVKQEGDIYTDGLSIMKKNPKTSMIEYKNLVVGAKDEKKLETHILQSSIEFINIHAGWDTRHRYASLDEFSREVAFRLYIDGLPVFNEEGMTEIHLEYGTQNVKRYERSYFNLVDEPLDQSAVTLPSANEALKSFKNGMGKQYDANKLTDMTVGYKLIYDDNSGTTLLELKPVWYYQYGGSWMEIPEKDLGGLMDGLE
ncbi:hypothetical protein F7984_18740 [Pradoshia sp. D12]|uniref:YycH family regulatory protein n=1 Tax=Bacillaceae TaxID=186817 RepID=UPI00080AEBB8|nr:MULTISPECIES: two-component system activity regulator YycH [Bacillaceae]OCA81188.1 hypothetical protein A8L44_16025 [Bacillus sp. FJAT-27986]QFK73121.1 hypothetical protein F7984_18740 [Pradoshia sp. D12]TPF72114.1 hypothetical protein FHY44_11435 [Bacillus sp. D12]